MLLMLLHLKNNTEKFEPHKLSFLWRNRLRKLISCMVHPLDLSSKFRVIPLRFPENFSTFKNHYSVTSGIHVPSTLHSLTILYLALIRYSKCDRYWKKFLYFKIMTHTYRRIWWFQVNMLQFEIKYPVKWAHFRALNIVNFREIFTKALNLHFLLPLKVTLSACQTNFFSTAIMWTTDIWIEEA